MPDEPRRIYWDACIFLSFVNGEKGRSEVIQQLLDEAAAGEFELVTSTVSIVEVAFGKAEQDDAAPDPDVLAAIEAFWAADAPVKLVEFHRLIALDARDLVRDARLSRDERLTPLDAVHLASAIRLEVEDFHTYDGPLLRFKGAIPFPIREPWTPNPRIDGWDTALS
jgi:predicted nucleic acid-binding protein